MRTPTPNETILGILAVQPQHGYQLLNHFQDPSKLGRIWSMSTSQVYAVLKRLEKQGYIQGSSVQSEDAPPRTEYINTSTGHEALQAWLYDPNPSTSVRRIRVEFFSKLYVAGLLAIPAQEIINLQREACQKQRQQMQTVYNEAQTQLEKQVSEFVIGQLDTAIGWLDACEKEYAETGK